MTAVSIALPLAHHESWMILLQDDCFYYLQVARNIAQGHGSTFNGIVPTNGYQPLWLWILASFAHFSVRPEATLYFIAFAIFLATVATFLLSWELLRATGVRALLIFASAAAVTLYSLTLYFYGMEVILTVPLMLGAVVMLRRFAWVTARWWRTICFGLLLSAMVLSRIDTSIFCLLLALAVARTPQLRSLLRPRVLTGIGLGFLPVAGYFLWNHAVFGTWLPVSGMAKQLRTSRVPSLEPWRVFFHPLAAAYGAILLASLALLPVVRRRLPAHLLFAMLAFAPLYYLVLSCVSDWTLWGWYMYPLRVALCAGLVVFCVWPATAKLLQNSAVVTVPVVAVLLGAGLLRWRHQQEDIDAASVDIEQFAMQHPGIYAMGDRAGRVAYRLPYPVIQTEGLMMDRAYLTYLQHSAPLRDVLKRYDVRYYIATAYEPFHGCFEAREPTKAGPTSRQLTAEFCEAPIATWTHDGIQTRVYQLD